MKDSLPGLDIPEESRIRLRTDIMLEGMATATWRIQQMFPSASAQQIADAIDGLHREALTEWQRRFAQRWT